MSLIAAYDDGIVRVYHADHAALAEHLRETGERADAMIVDAPYSERTHAGHDVMADRVRERHGTDDRLLPYAAWSETAVASLVGAFAPLVRNWLVSITDEHLRAAWRAEYERADLVCFPRVPAIETGATVRQQGDGPSSWTTDVVVAHTRGRRHIGAWSGASPYYLGPKEIKAWVGGKPVWLIRALVRDYSRPGDLIVDPCCGAGTLGVAVRYEGRRAILADKDPAAVECTIKRLRGERTKPTRDDFPETDAQPSLFARGAAE